MGYFNFNRDSRLVGFEAYLDRGFIKKIGVVTYDTVCLTPQDPEPTV